MTAIAVRPFDVRGALPTGVTMLEASAGTGKTFTIAALAARYVADGTPLDRLLLVTFTRMATGELRDRVRERLVATEQGLSRALAGAPPDDEVVALLAEGTPDTVRARRDRLSRALADFDAATIATTHGFCREVLSGLGVVGDVEPGTEFVEAIDDLLEEVVDDLYVRRFHQLGLPQFSRREAMQIARAAVENPTAPVVPVAAPENSKAAMRVRLALRVREELEARKRRSGVMTYDDLLTRLKNTLEGPTGPAAARRLRDRYGVVLVDEFQDTDPVQWDILRLAFAEGGVTLVLIGDPKQAIYAFRGADVYAYLAAAQAAGERATLDVNWRSDQALIDAYDALFGNARLGHEGIEYRRVQAAEAHREPGLDAAPVAAPLRLRLVPREDVETTPRGYARAASAREHIAADLAGCLVDLLSSPATVRTERGGQEPIRPRHIAVLVRTNRTAAVVREALGAAGIPAVISGAGSVFGTGPARDWLLLLEALERPASSPHARSLALTRFLGWSAERVASAGEREWEEVHGRLHGWAHVLRARGVAALLEAVTLAEGLPGRVLADEGGERDLTDLRHVGQLLHAAAVEEQMGAAALTGWLRRRIAAAREEAGNEERSRRLESDAEAVQVLTIHRSKGLEFPIVCCPDLWEPGRVPEGSEPVFFHDPEAGDARTVDVGLDGPDFPTHGRLHRDEQRGEDLRLAYVALTRARHQALVWWAASWDSRHSPLGRLLFSRRSDGTVPAEGRGTPTDEEAEARMRDLAAEAPGCIAAERAVPGPPRRWPGTRHGAAELTAAVFDRSLDHGWRRTSYTDITAGTGEPHVASEPEEPVVTDEPAVAAGPESPIGAAGSDPLRAVPSLLAAMPAGARVGTFVHHVLEATDFAAADLNAELGDRVAGELARRPVEVGDPMAVVAGLRAAIETPLGPLASGARLRDLARADRLDELDFELPLAGGDAPAGRLTPAAIGAVLREHAPAGDPVAAYADRLTDPALRQEVRGYLTGSVDLVMRLPGERFAIADFKTNWLGGDAALSAWHYRPAALADEMRRAHYWLQALLYTVALHRYLRWRLSGYDPERHLAGVVYLFLRGMTGAQTPTVDGTPCGVCAWRPPARLVGALSDALDRGSP
ncbi:MAG TPA: UvrD-helicase domain-containing protein [Solirubrobacteraceae bacterium]|jgi:exodeoxyribonuclease V beta subunit|nr:UvrD-helicase domain-containing protein [Solirubrobacteraceae bacterium]